MADIRQRKAFLDTRQSFEMRLTIENQAREQVIQFTKVSRLLTLLVMWSIVVLSSSYKKGATAAIRTARARSRQDASGSGHSSRRTIQEDLHEPARECQVSYRAVSYSFFFNSTTVPDTYSTYTVQYKYSSCSGDGNVKPPSNNGRKTMLAAGYQTIQRPIILIYVCHRNGTLST